LTTARRSAAKRRSTKWVAALIGGNLLQKISNPITDNTTAPHIFKIVCSPSSILLLSREILEVLIH
jgi:hypothetical protein